MAPIFTGLQVLALLSALEVSIASPSFIHIKRDVVIPTDLPGNWTSEGCYVDNTNGVRALSGASYTDTTDMTDEACISYCDGKGYIYAGTEYAQECYCGNSIDSAATTATGDCTTPCTGNTTEACGNGNRLNIFYSGGEAPAGPITNPGVGDWDLLGCYTEGADGRTLTTGMSVTGGAADMTVELCTAACQAALYTLAGVEYAQECYCGNSISNGGALTTSSDCDLPCAGNSSEYCGAGDRLDVYNFTGTFPTGSATATKKAVSTTSSVISTGTGTAADLPSGWTYRGCYIDNANGRIIANQQADDDTLTIESCISTCEGLGYTVAGAEYSVQCSCDDYISNGGTLTTDSDCDMACGGDSSEECGAGNRQSVYATGNLTIYPVPAPKTTGLPGSWEYQGCYTDFNVKVLPWQIILADNNTAENCLGLCSEYGYEVGGMEYGRECYCGDATDVTFAGSTNQTDSECSTTCTGSPTEICGGGNLLTLYQWTGTPITNWQHPTGNDMGAYEFLIGGVVVPLVTNYAVNGKVTFLEKSGTGAPNTTGAYELDLAQLNNFTGAWRPMHVKTDIFCSASLTLPDRVGRQINVGGWSGQSTFGIRLYWPDGSPGVWGTNDWQENYEEIELQAGRWYPSAMVMANGSILVVGGEQGSNAAPTPSLEILPKPDGGPTLLTMDWLQRTDPNNLYPFLMTLPSGGIFVAYYNEARILDETTFDTTKVLPNIPGSVNNFLAGRTYPLEGTGVILPQYAPYTDPITVLICGGSSTGAGEAIDNCVSTQPEVDDPEWVIERMPSKRVMSCITALPDGTYLIVNGAHQGVAGFGLATSPNLNAVLYDPTAALGSRFSVMANTTVARLYHSESMLLGDGRVLISGSDPEDDVHPEEYRVEVFVPPYLLSGLTKPTFTIENTDWTYGEEVEIEVTLNEGTTADIKISLMAAVGSTHGNSMGQRTLFPAFTCAGTTCTITAPPNAHVSTPGWHQLFVLDGPTPSNSQWVRIGGDPASLGNWPDFEDFSTPGVGAV